MRLAPVIAVTIALICGCSSVWSPGSVDVPIEPLAGWQCSMGSDGQHCRIALPRTNYRHAAVYIHKARYKIEAFLDDQKIYAFGTPGVSSERRYLGDPVHLIPLPDGYEGRTLDVHVWSDLGRIGMEGPTAIGDASALAVKVLGDGLPDLIIGALQLIIGLAALILWATVARLGVLAAFGTFSLGFGVFSLCHANALYLFAPYPLAWDHLQYAMTYLTPFAFLELSTRLVGSFRQRWLWAGRWVFPVLSAMALCGSLLGELDLPETLPTFQVAVLLLGLGLVAEVFFKVMAKVQAARVFGGGIALVCLASVHDVAVERGMLPWNAYASNVVMLGFIVLLAVVIAYRFRQDTERQVHLRRELETAGILQSRIMPEKTFNHEHFTLATFSRSASQVGGDWYAYRLIGERWLQVHVGDVTGHGTRAALVASFAKGAVDLYYEEALQRGVVCPGLDLLHELLNRTLYGMGQGEATMTLASVSIDLSTGVIHYVNSGHPPPVFYGERPLFLPERNKTMLGIEQSFVSEPPGLLQAGGQELLILHSDGIAELVPPEVRQNSQRATTDFLKLHAAENPTFVCELTSVFTAVASETRELEDDITVLAVKLALKRVANAA